MRRFDVGKMRRHALRDTPDTIRIPQGLWRDEEESWARVNVWRSRWMAARKISRAVMFAYRDELTGDTIVTIEREPR